MQANRQYVKLLTTAMYDVQKLRIMIDNRIGQFKRDSAEDESKKALADKLNATISKLANDMESNISSQLASAVEEMPIMEWLHKVKGIGPRYSGSLIGMINELPETVSALWKYCGMHTIDVCITCKKMYLIGDAKFKFLNHQADRRWETHLKKEEHGTYDETEFKLLAYREGEKALCKCEMPEVRNIAPKAMYYKGLLLDFSPFLKSTCWKIAGQFVRQGDFYRKYYETVKEKYQKDCPNITAGHIENRARRATAKMFLSHLWEMWRRAEGKPSGTFYLKYRLGEDFEKHHTLIEPPYSDTFEKVTIAAD